MTDLTQVIHRVQSTHVEPSHGKEIEKILRGVRYQLLGFQSCAIHNNNRGEIKRKYNDHDGEAFFSYEKYAKLLHKTTFLVITNHSTKQHSKESLSSCF